jgi:hypothetical protein
VDNVTVFTAMEWVWLVLSLAGLAVNAYGTYEARRDLRWVIESGINHGRKAAARRNLRRDATLLVVMVIYSVHGVVAVTTPPTPSQVMPFFQTYWLYLSQLVVIAMLIGLSARGQWEYARIRSGKVD